MDPRRAKLDATEGSITFVGTRERKMVDGGKDGVGWGKWDRGDG